jgi:signal transduction histidine kinase
MIQRLSEHAQTRLRIPILLLGALLLTMLTISGLTLYALKGQRAELEKTLSESQEQALAFLANRLEQSLLNAVQNPFLILKNIPQEEIAEARLHLLRSTFPAVEQVLFLDQQMALIQSFPPPLNEHQGRFNQWIVQRLQEEEVNKESQPFSLHTFVETISGQPALFAFQPINDIPSQDTNVQASNLSRDGWVLMRFNLDVLKASRVAPLLAEFSQEQGGPVQLQDPEFAAGKDSLSVPLTRILPGWMLVFKPPRYLQQERLHYQSWAIIGVAGAALVAIAITGFAIWWEVRREYALVELRNRFVANVSHELKTPLSLIRMYAETLYLRRLNDPQKQHEYHRIMLREAERLSQMINNVLDFARLRAGVELYQLTETDLRATVAAVLAHYRPQLEERGARIDAFLQEQLPPVSHDPNGVPQILLNLLDNAFKYATSGGVVQVHLVGDSDWVELQVIDFGPGIPAEEHARLRQAFQRGRMTGTTRGSGLGLELVEHIAQAHHAHFILDTPEDHSGVKAIVSFPSYKGKP